MIAMNKKRIFILISLVAVIVFFVFIFKSVERKAWNDIMLFVNFGILVFLFIKYAKNPLMNYLRGERAKISKEISSLEDQVQKARELMEAEADKYKDMDARVKEIQENIIELGKKEKEEMIEKAKNTADLMVSDAKAYAFHQMELARRKFGEEMLDKAVDIAVKALRKDMSSDDDDKIINQFAQDISTRKNNFA